MPTGERPLRRFAPGQRMEAAGARAHRLGRGDSRGRKDPLEAMNPVVTEDGLPDVLVSDPRFADPIVVEPGEDVTRVRRIEGQRSDRAGPVELLLELGRAGGLAEEDCSGRDALET
jgi:hypothetical protein